MNQAPLVTSLLCVTIVCVWNGREAGSIRLELYSGSLTGVTPSASSTADPQVPPARAEDGRLLNRLSDLLRARTQLLEELQRYRNRHYTDRHYQVRSVLRRLRQLEQEATTALGNHSK